MELYSRGKKYEALIEGSVKEEENLQAWADVSCHMSVLVICSKAGYIGQIQKWNMLGITTAGESMFIFHFVLVFWGTLNLPIWKVWRWP